MNTKQVGKLRMFVYKTANEYVGVCLELNLVVREKTQKQAIKHIIDMSLGYIETVNKENLNDKFLNEKVAFSYLLKYYSGLFFNRAIFGFRNFFSVELPVIDGKYAVPIQG